MKVDVDKIRHALSRLDWAEVVYRVWINICLKAGTYRLIPRIKLKCKTKGLINHDRVLHDRDELTM